MFAGLFSKASAPPAVIMERYDRYIAVMRKFQLEIPRTISKSEFERAAKAIGLLRGGVFLMGGDSECAVFTDFAIYGLLDAQFESAVTRYFRAHPQRPGSDEEMVAEAMSRSRYSLLSVNRIVPGVGVECYDILRKRKLLMANHGLSMTAQVGMVLANRLISVPGFEISTGADLPVDADTGPILYEMLLRASRDIGLTSRNIDEPDYARKITELIIRICLAEGCAERIVRLEDPSDFAPQEHEQRQLPVQGVPRNRPCPCGSGIKYKHCCGELIRR